MLDFAHARVHRKEVASLSESVWNTGNKGLRPFTIKSRSGEELREPQKAMGRDMSSGAPLYERVLVRVICLRWGVPAFALCLFRVAGQAENKTSYPGLG